MRCETSRNDGAQQTTLPCARREMFHNISYANQGTGGLTRAFDCSPNRLPFDFPKHEVPPCPPK